MKNAAHQIAAPLPAVNLLSDKQISRFWASVEIGTPDSCWLWKKSTDRDGYGCCGWAVCPGRSYRSHRIAYELANGPIAQGLCACHSCDNPTCCNPAHIWIGTNKENIADSVKKHRRSSTHQIGAVGIKNSHAVLNDDLVRQIRAERTLPNRLSNAKLAEKYGVIKSAIDKIVYRKTWKHVL